MSTQRFKYLALGITCFLLGAMFLQPAAAHIIASKNAHTLAKKHLSYFAARSWVKNNYLSKTRTYSRTQSNNRFLTQAAAASTYLTQSNAASTYLTQSNATSTYLTQINAASTYLPLGGGTLSGGLTGPSFLYSSNQTKSRLYTANEFIPRTDLTLTYTEGGNAFYKSAGLDNSLGIGVHLPQGAVVTGLTIYSYDNSDSSISLLLGRSPLSSTGASSMASVISSGSLGSAGYSNTTNSIDYNTIDNDSYFYYLNATITSSSSSLTFRGAKISYTTTKVDGDM